ncbi:TVP38/TMEM64 family protein [Aquisalibacillus elongatus]|uniref:TVP38/TMEM64 family membrane protein n=1 Tax=Aquisalibacillus elongatus TaxID=485577 RepID=A0A3N5C1P8_9BACI|nr:TVP38/TMEM64 family protein [Aquisalibacillus elongatus]RPF50101.1 putative membrane protein YdjX (TVP38/TMEM64 family) [Aquisalibacillus elongatus]
MQLSTLLKGIIVFIFVLLLYSFHQRLFHISPEDIRNIILTAGWFSPVYYILLFMFRPLVLFPASVFSIVGGLAFGSVWGFFLAITGATAGAAVAFWISRKLGEDTFKKLKNQKVLDLKHHFEERGFLYILLLRLLPVINFDLISYGVGLSKVRFMEFLKATLIGIIPGTLIYAFLGASLVEGNRWTVTMVVFIYIVLVLVPILWRKNIMNRIDQVNEKNTTEG